MRREDVPDRDGTTCHIVGARKLLADGDFEWYLYVLRGTTLDQFAQVLGQHADDPTLSLTWCDVRKLLAQAAALREEDTGT